MQPTLQLPTLRDVSRAERYGKTVKVVPGKPKKHGSYKFIPSPKTPPCTYCGAPAAWRLDIKVDWFRGNDQRTRACADCYARIK